MGEENTSTRICIKNVPPSFDEAKLKSYLQSGQPSLKLTDCKLLKTKDGRSRKIAFVGFKTHDMAQTAVSYFDRSFALTSRLGVSFAFSKKDGNDDYRPWSKHSAGSSRNQKEQEKEQQMRDGKTKSDSSKTVQEESNAEDTDEPEHIRRKREEFLSAMGITTSKNKNDKSTVSKSKFWSNDDAAPSVEDSNVAVQQEQPTSNDENGADNDSDNESSNSSSSSSSELDEEADMKREDSKPKSDLDFLRSKQVEGDILSEDDSDDDDSDDSSSDSDSSDDSSTGSATKNVDGTMSEDVAGTDAMQTQDVADEKLPSSTSERQEVVGDRLFVRNLPFTTTEEELMEAFSQVGVVLSAHIPIDDMKKNKGYGFVTFQSKLDAKIAMERMDGQDFQGRLIHILPAKASSNPGENGSTNATYKEQKALARQKEAESNTKSWQSSILRGDAVVDNLSDRLNMSKGDVLDVKDGISSGNAAVRLALGETHIIAENREFFLKHGVDLTLTEKDGVKRSKSSILVKNLPFDTSLEDLTKVFHAIGGDTPSQILLPPSKTAALVEYGHANDARRAFRRLAYKKFKHIPLYLEWAPLSEEAREQTEPSTEGHVVKDVVEKDLKSNALSNETADETVSQSIYIKNLNFQTTEEQLKKAFAKAGFQPRNVRIPTKAAPLKKSGASSEPLSMGYGFVEFGSEEDALNAMKSLQGKLIDGHAVSIQLSAKSLSSKATNVSAESKSSSKNTKIMVRNVPFEATRSELLKLFGAFGQLKKVRLPKKIDGTHRGFAFCEFLTNKEAKNAKLGLSGTHLYGRHLVLEWASPDGDDKMNVTEAREKTKRDAMKAGLGSGASGSDKKKGRHTKF